MQVDWNALGEVPYKKWHVYDMEWLDTIQIEDYHVCGAPFGGPIALIRDDKKLTQLTDEHLKPKLRIFTSSGKKLAEIEWNDRKVAGMGWSDQEQLVIVFEDGNVIVYDIYGHLVRNFLLGEGNSQFIECHFWGNGVVGLTSDMQLFVYEGLTNNNDGKGKYSLRSGLSKDKPYSSMAIVSPSLSRSSMLEVILATEDKTIIVIDEYGPEDQLLQKSLSSPITKISVAPNGKFLACFKKDGILTVLDNTFTQKVIDFDTKSKSKPMEVTWCGDDAVILLWKNTGLVMVGPYGDWLNYPYNGAVTVISELDCCRIITSSTCEILQRVPPSTEAIKRIGSTDPGALLYDATEGYLEGDPKSDDIIRSIALTNQLQYAVKSCISAASAEFDITRQQAFYRAASYGKAFCQNFDPEEFVEIGKKLRILNDIRRPEIGLPLTIQEYIRLTPEILVNRLTVRNHHFLALKICELLKLPNSSVLVHWASEKVKKLTLSSASDEEITSLITYKLRPYRNISFLDIAAAAYHMGRRKLATLLLELESNPSDQVPLLLSMNEDELALQKAITSGDTDLIYLTLIHLEKSQPNTEIFYNLISNYPEAVNLLKIYYQRKGISNNPMLSTLLLHNRNYYEAGVSSMTQAFNQLSNYPRRLELVRESIHYFSQSKDLKEFKLMTEEEYELMEMQKALEVRTGKDFMNMSISETLENIYYLSIEHEIEVMKWNQEATKIIKKFKVSDKMVWYLRIKCYSSRQKWDLLMKLANEKRSPIGYKPFAIACQKYGQSEDEIEKYVDRISSNEEKCDVYIELKIWRRAADSAYKMKDLHKLQQILRACRDPNLERQIQDMINRC